MPLDVPLDELPVVVVREPGRTPLVVVLHEMLEVGRDGTGLLIDDPRASRSHLQLEQTEDGVMVRDMDTTNGTFLDGQRITEPTRLIPGSRVRVGSTTIELLPASIGALQSADEETATTIQRIANEVASDSVARPTGLKRDATVTIVFTDIESSTELSTALGDKRWFEVLSEHNTLIRNCVKEYHGFEVKARGDGFMLAFDSTHRAVEAMIRAQQTITEGFGDADPPLRIRVGAHTGEAISDEDGDMYGYHVNLAARIADQASGGEILVSELLKQIVEARGELRFGEPRRVQLKGLSGSYVVFPVEWR